LICLEENGTWWDWWRWWNWRRRHNSRIGLVRFDGN
jgi:hypothetical protein